MPIRTFLLLMLFFLATGMVSAAVADYYKYTDKSGAVAITNKLDSVPQKYRSSVKVITDDALANRDPGSRQQVSGQQVNHPSPDTAPQEAVAPTSAPALAGKLSGLFAQYAWLKPVACVVAILAAFLVVIKLTALVPSPLLSKLIYLSFFLGVFVFLYKTYVDHMVRNSIAIKEKAVTLLKKANVRESPLPGEKDPSEMK